MVKPPPPNVTCYFVPCFRKNLLEAFGHTESTRRFRTSQCSWSWEFPRKSSRVDVWLMSAIERFLWWMSLLRGPILKDISVKLSIESIFLVGKGVSINSPQEKTLPNQVFLIKRIQNEPSGFAFFPPRSHRKTGRCFCWFLDILSHSHWLLNYGFVNIPNVSPLISRAYRSTIIIPSSPKAMFLGEMWHWVPSNSHSRTVVILRNDLSFENPEFFLGWFTLISSYSDWWFSIAMLVY